MPADFAAPTDEPTRAPAEAEAEAARVRMRAALVDNGALDDSIFARLEQPTRQDP